MNREELIENLGTIARSGTAAILENLKNQGQEKDMNLIGQFWCWFLRQLHGLHPSGSHQP